jgi:hypothetical protein
MFLTRSEDIEPMMASIVGTMFKRCEDAKATGDKFKLEDACGNFWFAVKGVQKIAIALRGGRESNDPAFVHFSIASMNEMRRVRDYIIATCGVDPQTAPMWN